MTIAAPRPYFGQRSTGQLRALTQRCVERIVTLGGGGGQHEVGVLTALFGQFHSGAADVDGSAQGGADASPQLMAGCGVAVPGR